MYYAPGSLSEAVSLYVAHPQAILLGGGTDVLVNVAHGRSTLKTIIDLKRVCELGFISEEGKNVKIGSMTTISDVGESLVIHERYPFLQKAALKLGSWQIRNMATVGGNLCNAAPSAELATPLLAANATAVLVGPNGERKIALSELFRGPGKTTLGQGEIMKEVVLPPLEDGVSGIYMRHQLRRSMDISIVNMTVLLQFDNDVVSDASIYLGAVAPTPMRAKETEKKLIGHQLDDMVIEAATETAAAEAKPITDVRASEKYRRQMVKVYMKRALTALRDREVSPR
ncbi:MAG: FAD binding domain-containing protein [Syntrophaceticus sp.]|jgi:carbon-monoxide dehydrogenase medium subunit